MCNASMKDRKSSHKLRGCLGLVNIRNWWFGQRLLSRKAVKKCKEIAVEGHRGRSMDKDSWVKKCKEIVVEVHWGRGMDKDSWVKKCKEIAVEGHGGRGMDKDSWVKKCKEIVVEGHWEKR